ncbi:MAG TPA: response regulator transcription factor [Jatrophihabitans sp.]|jgi:two-component system response regulator DevR|nr:response regulator transcription factor [Jatrophihabitans sp.]
MERNPTGQSVRIFLLDDHHVVRHGIAELLNAEPDFEVVGEAGTATEALAGIPAIRPDVAVLDARLPDGDGIDVCRRIRSTLPQTYCLILTSHHDPDAMLAAVLAGASGYLLKEVRTSGLLDAIRQAAAGRSVLDPAVITRAVEQVRLGTPAERRLAGLTNREREVLDLLAEGLTNREIGKRLSLSEKTAKNTVSSLLHKLDLQHRTQAALLAAELRDPHRPRMP